jgi:hypothetical protein
MFNTGNASVETQRMIIHSNSNVGIGDFFGASATPLDRLHVLGVGNMIRTDHLGPSPLYTYLPGDGMVIANSSGQLYTKIGLNGNPNLVLSGTGTWIPMSGGAADADWYEVGTSVPPNHIDDIKYSNGYLQVNNNIAVPNAVFDVQNNSAIPNFSNTGAALFNTDATGFAIPLPNPFTNVACNIVNIPNANTTVYGLGSRVVSESNHIENAGVFGTVLGYTKLHSGVKGKARDASENIGVWGESTTYTLSTNNIGKGVYGYSHSPAICNNSKNYGVYGRADNGLNNAGGYFISNSNNQCVTGVQVNCGVYGEASNANNNYGVFGKAPILPHSWAGFFQGNLAYTGIHINVSDSSIKRDVEIIPNALETVTLLNPKQFYFKTEEYPYANLSEGLQFGLIAQDVETILPNLVTEITIPPTYDSLGIETSPALTLKGLNYNGLIPIALEAIKQLDSIVQNDSIYVSNGINKQDHDIKLGGPLTENTNVTLGSSSNGYNLFLQSDSDNPGQFQIGAPYTAYNEAMAINNDYWTYAARMLSTRNSSSTNYGLSIETSGSTFMNVGASVLAESNNNAGFSIGIISNARNGNNTNYGAQIRGSGNETQNNYGIFCAAEGKANYNYGIYAEASGGANNYAGFFSGPLYASSYLNLP